MKALPSGIFKILCNHRTMNSMHSFLKTTAKISNRTIYGKVCPVKSEVISIIKNYPSPVPWKQVMETLAEENDDIKKVIIETCLELKDVDAMMSFCKYIIEKGENISEMDLFFIVKTLSLSPQEKILEYEELLIYLFNEFKDFMMDSKLFQFYALPVFSKIPYCFKQIVPEVKSHSEVAKNILICQAFDLDDLSTAWKLCEITNSSNFGEVLVSFTNFCIRQALQNKFSIDLIQTFVNMCQKRGVIIYSTDVMCALLPLINVLNYCQDDYIWSVKKCTVNPQMECLNCNATLKDVMISENEYEELKNTFLKTVIFKNDVFLKSSYSELSAFKNFLKTCKPYDLVMDGLNFAYRGFHSSRKDMVRYIVQNFINHNKKKVLIISREHLSKDKLKKFLPKAQIFYTENSSDDDVFILYAAMHAGPKTDFITSDFLGTHAAKLDPEMKTLFIKWQLCHQYVIDPEFGVVLPSRHLGLSQCTDSPETGGDSYKWHLSYQEKMSPYCFRLKFDWLCLQAIPKKRVKQKIVESPKILKKKFSK